jgi:hypothetical protein
MAEMAVHRLKAAEAPVISPLRSALAARIEASRAASARSTAVASAFETAELTVRQARRKLEAAEAGLEQAKADAGTFLTAVALGTAGERGPRRSGRRETFIRTPRTNWHPASPRAMPCVTRRRKARDIPT